MCFGEVEVWANVYGVQGSEIIDPFEYLRRRYHETSVSVSETGEWSHHIKAKLLTVVQETGREVDDTPESFPPRHGEHRQPGEEVEAGGRDPISSDKRASDEDIVVIVGVVDNPVHDLWRNPHRRCRFSEGLE